MALKLNPVRHLQSLKRTAFSHGKKFASEDAPVAEPLGLKQIGAVFGIWAQDIFLEHFLPRFNGGRRLERFDAMGRFRA